MLVYIYLYLILILVRVGPIEILRGILTRFTKKHAMLNELGLVPN